MRINNFQMAAYAAIAVGLINLRYQTGSDSNLVKSALLVIPGCLLLAATFIKPGLHFWQSKTATVMTTTVGGLLLIYSFLL